MSKRSTKEVKKPTDLINYRIGSAEKGYKLHQTLESVDNINVFESVTKAKIALIDLLDPKLEVLRSAMNYARRIRAQPEFYDELTDEENAEYEKRVDELENKLTQEQEAIEAAKAAKKAEKEALKAAKAAKKAEKEAEKKVKLIERESAKLMKRVEAIKKSNMETKSNKELHAYIKELEVKPEPSTKTPKTALINMINARIEEIEKHAKVA